MKRRGLIKKSIIGSTALLTGAAALSVPIFAEEGDGEGLFSVSHTTYRNRFMTAPQLSEAALEDLIVELERPGNSVAIRPTHVVIVRPPWYT